jgi:DNA-binding response OmpR family regulator
MKPVCPYCNAPLVTERLGIHMSPLKARLFDAVKHAGEEGVTAAELKRCWTKRISSTTVRVHVSQINELLEVTDWHISSDGTGYRLKRVRW